MSVGVEVTPWDSVTTVEGLGVMVAEVVDWLRAGI